MRSVNTPPSLASSIITLGLVATLPSLESIADEPNNNSPLKTMHAVTEDGEHLKLQSLPSHELFADLTVAMRESLKPDISTSTNYSVMGPTKEISDLLVRRAEALRKELALEWIGEPLPDEPQKMTIHVSIDSQLSLARVYLRDENRNGSMYLCDDLETLYHSTLPHELAHDVISNISQKELPKWVQEGIASRYDNEKRKNIRTQLMREMISMSTLPDDLERFLENDHFPRQSYAISVSLVEYLLTKGTKKQFTQFAQDSCIYGYSESLEKHYRIKNVATLNDGWKSWLNEQDY